MGQNIRRRVTTPGGNSSFSRDYTFGPTNHLRQAQEPAAQGSS